MRRLVAEIRNKLVAVNAVDRAFAICLLPVVLAILVIVCPLLLLVQGRPIFFVSERMKNCDAPFQLLKLRTMNCHRDAQQAAHGGHSRQQVTPFGAWLRALRIDELPQIFNVLRGDIRFIGPRPPLRKYVEDYPELYARVFERAPGITGLATVRYHAREARILQACRTAEETDATYRRTCIRAKARLDLFYLRRRSLVLDMKILFWTFSRLSPRPLPRRAPGLGITPRALRGRGNLKVAS